ncbi:MAG: hypothetical protein MK185_05995 [Saccharospirillaceae bacterium]|nr:hypothetical protein A3759_22955 [Thalassolituus sp. HI0120]KZZ46093.1 hypothetical protein A3759_07690 [Thalassolituus sp. HI0120]MCH2040167.1 hypothetical protein [Saccharospirillaceae bacterium]
MIKRSAKFVAAVLLIILGIVITPLPIPLGLLSILIGLSLLVSVVPSVRHWLIQLRRKYRQSSVRLNQIGKRMPAFLRELIEETDPDKPECHK